MYEPFNSLKIGQKAGGPGLGLRIPAPFFGLEGFIKLGEREGFRRCEAAFQQRQPQRERAGDRGGGVERDEGHRIELPHPVRQLGQCIGRLAHMANAGSGFQAHAMGFVQPVQ